MLRQPNEHYRGSPQDKAFVSEYLRSLRRIDLSSLVHTSRYVTLGHFLGSASQALVDPDLFVSVSAAVERHLLGKSALFARLPESRFIIGDNPDPNDVGGFHSIHARGYKDMHLYGFAVPLNPLVVDDVAIRTLELVRSYMHDSIHYSQFRSYRRTPSFIQMKRFAIYRDQCSLTFRHPNGVSYSPRHLDGPRLININLLQDGMDVLMVADAMAPYLRKMNSRESLRLERAMLSDLEASLVGLWLDSRARSFHTQVTLPSMRFLEYWAGADAHWLRDELFRVMLSGRLNSISAYFDGKVGAPGSWKSLFMSEEWITLRRTDRSEYGDNEANPE